MLLRRRRPSPALIVACLALFVALGGPAQAAKLINGKLLRKASVTSRAVRDRTLSTRDLSRSAVKALQKTPARSVGTGQLADGAVGASQLQAGAVTAGALAVNSLTGATIADATIGTADLADGAVTSDKIGTSEVKKADIATGAVGQAELARSAVTGNEVANGSLSALDVADFSGTVAPALAARVPHNDCVSASSPALTPNTTGASLLDDVVLAGQPKGWPSKLSVAARPLDVNVLEVTVCNPTAADIALPAPAPPIPFVAIQS